MFGLFDISMTLMTKRVVIFFLALASFISVDAQNEVVGGYVKKGGTESGLCRELHCISLINRGQSHIKCCEICFFSEILHIFAPGYQLYL